MIHGTETAHSTLGTSLTVLVVDDEPLVAMLIIDVLGDLGFNTLQAADGQSGLEMLRSNRAVDLLITDIGLPGGMNGRQFAELARQEHPRLKLLFITGYAERSLAGVLPTGSQLIAKPFSIDTLANTIAAMVAGAEPA